LNSKFFVEQELALFFAPDRSHGLREGRASSGFGIVHVPGFSDDLCQEGKET
jgi:hypothetical protein